LLWLLAVKKKKLLHLHQLQQLKLQQQHQQLQQLMPSQLTQLQQLQQLMPSQLTQLQQLQQLTLSQLTQLQQNNQLIIGKADPKVGFFYACAVCSEITPFLFRRPLHLCHCPPCSRLLKRWLSNRIPLPDTQS